MRLLRKISLGWPIRQRWEIETDTSVIGSLVLWQAHCRVAIRLCACVQPYTCLCHILPDP